jgi:hypothetical protein
MVRLPLEAAGTNAETDPRQRVNTAAIFMFSQVKCGKKKKIGIKTLVSVHFHVATMSVEGKSLPIG